MPARRAGRAHLGAASEAGREYFARLWAIVRPVLTGREAVEPRI